MDVDNPSLSRVRDLSRRIPIDNSRCPAFYYSLQGAVDDMWIVRLECLARMREYTGDSMYSQRTRSESPQPVWSREKAGAGRVNFPATERRVRRCLDRRG